MFMMHDPPHPGELIKEDYLEPLGLSITEASKKLCITRKTLSLLINGKQGISVEMAWKLSKAFNTTPQFWLNLQNQYDLFHSQGKTNLDDVQVLYG